MLRLVLIGIFSVVLCCQAAEDWCYGDVACEPSTWSSHYPYCGYLSQSPINIITSQTEYSSELGPIYITGLAGYSSAVVTNNGHSVEVTLSSEYLLSRPGLANSYKLAGFHFHFGNKYSPSQGSEHLVNGFGFPLEAHFVFYNTKYGSLAEAKTYSDGLSVVGVLYEIGATNEALRPLINILPQVAYKGQFASLYLNFERILPYRLGGYYTYQGSLTTPPCSENVTWHVLRGVQQLDWSQYKAITTSLYFTGPDYAHPEPMVDNFRPIQPKNGRPVYKY
ncbi:carbonic anhydrase 12-like [Gastrophryne carolinensis]